MHEGDVVDEELNHEEDLGVAQLVVDAVLGEAELEDCICPINNHRSEKKERGSEKVRKGERERERGGNCLLSLRNVPLGWRLFVPRCRLRRGKEN